jgi:putative chitinase
MNANLIAACTGATISLAETYAPHLTFAMDAYEISTPIRQAMCLSNVGHESMRLARTTENLNYRAEALISQFGRHRISEGLARKYGRTATQPANPEGIANTIYGGEWGAKNLGNIYPGDGWKFCGHGLIQSTGRANAKALTLRMRKKFPALNVPDFEANPELLTQPRWAALSAADYIDMKRLNAVADTGDFDGYCDRINFGKKTDSFGDTEGWSDRLDLFRSAKVALRLP